MSVRVGAPVPSLVTSLPVGLGAALETDAEPRRVYRRAKLSENCQLWNRHQKRRPRSRIHPLPGSACLHAREGEFHERAVRLAMEHRDEYQSEASALTAITGNLGCSPDGLRVWMRQVQRDGGERPGPTSAEIARIKELERENRELRQANEILRKASAYFAQAELDRPFRK